LELQPYIFNAGGAILEEAGLSSDISILCREMGIPAVVNVAGVSKLLDEGEVIELNGDLGGVYKYIDEPVEASNWSDIGITGKTLQIPASGFGSGGEKVAIRKPDDFYLLENPIKHEKIPTATKVLISGDKALMKLGDYLLASDGIVNIDLDNLVINGEIDKLAVERIDKIADLISPYEIIVSIGATIGVTKYLSEQPLLKKVLTIVKKLRNVYRDRNVSLAVHSPLNGNYMSEIKKEISANGLRRGSTFNLYAVVESSSEVLLLEDIYGAEIDGVIINTPSIACEIQGLDRSDESAKYDLNADSVISIIEKCVKTSGKLRKRTIIVCEKNEKLVKDAVKMGVYAVSVDMESIVDVKGLVQKEEMSLIRSR